MAAGGQCGGGNVKQAGGSQAGVSCVHCLQHNVIVNGSCNFPSTKKEASKIRREPAPYLKGTRARFVKHSHRD